MMDSITEIYIGYPSRCIHYFCPLGPFAPISMGCLISFSCIGFCFYNDSRSKVVIILSTENFPKQISTYGLDAVIANFMDEVRNNTSPRCRIVMPGGKANVLQDRLEMCEAIEAIISAN